MQRKDAKLREHQEIKLFAFFPVLSQIRLGIHWLHALHREESLYFDLVRMSVPEAWSPVTAWMLFLLVVSQVPRTCLQSHSCYGLWTWCTEEYLTLVPLQPPFFFSSLFLYIYESIIRLVVGPSASLYPENSNFFFYFSLRIILCFSSILDLCLELLTLGPCEAHKVRGQSCTSY